MKENLYTTDCIRSSSGKYVNVFDPDPSTILIEDIAHALSFAPRFGGHLPELFSVAQHSLNCMEAAPPSLKLQALMHDASEAYLLDMPRPIKHRMPEYQAIEEHLMEVIAKKFDIPWPLDPEIKVIDKLQLEREWELLMMQSKTSKFKPINVFNPPFSKIKFLQAFNRYAKV
jgi:hypothetical protein